MSMENIRLDLFDNLVQPVFRISDQHQLLRHRQAGKRTIHRGCAKKRPAIDLLLRNIRTRMFGRGQVEGFPAERALLLQDGQGPEGVAALQRDRMVQDVENSHRRQPVFRMGALDSL